MWSRRSNELDPQAEDRALVRRMRAGEEPAFEQFFNACFHPLYRFALVRVDYDVVPV